MALSKSRSRLFVCLASAVLAAALGASRIVLGLCGPFSDVAPDAFCAFVLEIFYLGITTGTTPTTYDPSSSVTRLQMAAFLSRSVDGVMKRRGRKVLTDKYWNPQNDTVLGVTTLGVFGPAAIRFDGSDLWVAIPQANSVTRVRASDAKILENWTGMTNPSAIQVALGRILVTGRTSPGALYMLDPAAPAGAATVVASNLGENPNSIAFDGARLFITNEGPTGSVSLVTPASAPPWPAANVVSGFTQPFGAAYDGANVWVTDTAFNTLLKLDAAGAILQTVTLGTTPTYPLFDGANLWVPNLNGNTVSVVRPSSGAVLKTLTGNGLNRPVAAAFDGERVLVVNNNGSSVSLFKAADLTPVGSVSLGASKTPQAAACDGAYFWITHSNVLVRF